MGFESDKLQEALEKAKKKQKAYAGLLSHVDHDDLLNFGMIPEFVGRLPVITSLEELSKDDMRRILVEPKNAPIKQYQKLFSFDDVTLKFTDSGIDAIIDKAMDKKTGARALRTILEHVLLDSMFDLPELKKKGKVLVIDAKVVNSRTKPRVLKKAA